MVYFLFILNALLMIVMPLALATFIARRRRQDWGLFGWGALAFVLSQVFHIPFNGLLGALGVIPAGLSDPNVSTPILLQGALVLGLSAGLFEEPARYLAYHFPARRARTSGNGLMLGAGHGGIESIILGFIVLVNALVLISLHENLLPGVLASIPEEQIPLLEAQMAAVFDTPPHLILLGALERIFALTAHLAMSLLVLQCFTRGRIYWLFLSIGFHTLLNAVAVFVSTRYGAMAAEVALFLLALVALGIIWWLGRPEPEPPTSDTPSEPLPAVTLKPPKVTAEKLDETRFH